MIRGSAWEASSLGNGANRNDNPAMPPPVYHGIYHLQRMTRFDSDEVFIRRDTETGDVILSRKPDRSWEWFVGRRDAAPVPDDFMADRLELPPQERELF